MIVNSKSWHYKIYGWSYTLFVEKYPPVKTNLCQYVQRLVIWVPLMLLATACFFILMAFMNLLLAVSGFWFGYRPSTLLLPNPVKYQGLQVGPVQLYPWHLILPALFIWMNYHMFHTQNERFVRAMSFLDGLIGTLLFCLFIMLFSKSESGKLLRAYLSAKKTRVCPLVEFKDEPTSE